MRQPAFSEMFGAPVVPVSQALAPATRRRLSRQAEAMLARLQAGPATNRELVGIGLNYRARISDLRAAGYDVVVQSHDHGTGLVVYVLRAA